MGGMASLGWLRRQAVGWSLPRNTGTLAATLAEIEFVQADPIQAPARTQDQILRQRVRGYRVGDLDRHYPALDVDEDRLYAYGFLARRLRPYLYPRRDRRAVDGKFVLAGRAIEVLAYVREHGVTHPRDVQAHVGHEQVTNDWGGKSSATTLDLERLRHYGFLRSADRVAGVRRYEVAPPLGDPLDPDDRLRALALLVARILAPLRVAGRPGAGRDRPAGAGTVTGAVRPGGLGPPALRPAVGLGVPVRGVHARAQAGAGLLRDAVAVAGPGDRVGELRRRRQRRRGQIHRPRTGRDHVREGARRGDRPAEDVPHLAWMHRG